MTGGNIYLTFDDGPCEPYTSQILSTLQKYEAKATFFVCGKNAEKFPDSVKAINAAGHGLGNHAYSHDWKKIFSASLVEEFEKTNLILTAITGQTHKLARPPWGLINSKTKKTLEAKGYVFYHWDLAAFDWWQLPANHMAKMVINKAKPESIILLHDGHNVDQKHSRANTVAALPIIIETLRKQGYKLAALNEAIRPSI